MQFYFIRHAQSENNSLWMRTGSSKGRSDDPALTQVGQQQAALLADYIQQADRQSPDAVTQYDLQNAGGFHFTHLYCSMMIRSVATGKVLSRALEMPLVAWVDLHETGGIHHVDEETGERTGLPGKNRAYFETHHPELILPDSLGEEGWWNRPFEEREQRPGRARRFLADLLERHGGTADRVAAVSHGGFYNQVIKAILGLPPEQDLWFSLNNAAICRIDFVEYGTNVIYLNQVSFLPDELIT